MAGDWVGRREAHPTGLDRRVVTSQPCLTAQVRVSAFWQLMEQEFGAASSRAMADHHVLGELGGVTATVALAGGVDPRQVWLALCRDFDVPPERRFGVEQRSRGPHPRQSR